MISMTVRTRDEIPKVIRKAKRANIDSIGRAAAFTRGVMKRKLSKRKKPRPPGQPAASPTGRAKKSVLFAYDRRSDSAIIGPSHNIVGRSMHAHEFGTKHKGDRFPARPFAGPTIEDVSPKLSQFWRGSIKGN